MTVVPIRPGENLGRLLDSGEVAREIFEGKRCARWVRDTVPGRMKLGGQTFFWYENQVREWMLSKVDQ